MDELKLLVEMVASLPSLAVWVVVAFYIYKISIIGSIYGVIRFVASKIHDVLIAKKTLPTITQEINLEDRLRGIAITSDDTLNLLIKQLSRVKSRGFSYKNSEDCGKGYIHSQSVDWLREAIDDKEEKDKEKLNGTR